MSSEKRASAKPSSSDRPKKAQKTSHEDALSLVEFMAQALPLHLHLTHTPPTVATSSSESKNTKETSHPSGGGSDDPGHLASLTLLPSEFSTGSYGWKSAKRITIELTDPESGSKRKVQVMINVNATVVGSKDAPRGEDSDAVAVGEASAEAEDEAEEEAELEEK